MTYWPKEITDVSADSRTYFEELRQRLEDPESVIALGSHGGVRGFRELTLGEKLAEPAEPTP